MQKSNDRPQHQSVFWCSLEIRLNRKEVNKRKKEKKKEEEEEEEKKREKEE